MCLKQAANRDPHMCHHKNVWQGLIKNEGSSFLKIFSASFSPPLVSHLLALFTLNLQEGEIGNTLLPKHIWLIWISPSHLYFTGSEPFGSPVLRNRHWELIREFRASEESNGLERALGGLKKAPILSLSILRIWDMGQCAVPTGGVGLLSGGPSSGACLGGFLKKWKMRVL